MSDTEKCPKDNQPRQKLCFNEIIESYSKSFTREAIELATKPFSEEAIEPVSKSCVSEIVESSSTLCPTETTESTSESCPTETTESTAKLCPNEDKLSASKLCLDETTEPCAIEDGKPPAKICFEEEEHAPVKSCYQICIEESDESTQGRCSETLVEQEPPFEIVEIELDEKLIDIKSPGGSAGSDQKCESRDFLNDLTCVPCNLPGDRGPDEPIDSQSSETCDDGGGGGDDSGETSGGKEASLGPCTCSGTCSEAPEASLKTCTCEGTCDGDRDTLRSCTCSGPCEPTGGPRLPRLLPTECTLAIIKPDGMMYLRQIERTILDEGFAICRTRWLKLTPGQVSDFYGDASERDNFAQLVAYMSSGPILVLLISKVNAVEEWRRLIGPTKVRDARRIAPDSIRGRYGRKGDDTRNAVHGSASLKAASRETRFFFPDHVTEPIPSDDDAADYVLKRINDLLIEGLVKLCEAKPEDPVSWLGNWLLENNPNGPKCLMRV